MRSKDKPMTSTTNEEAFKQLLHMNNDQMKRRQIIPFISATLCEPNMQKRLNCTEQLVRNAFKTSTPLGRANSLVPAVFLDRDGTLLEDNGPLRSPMQAAFYPETAPALRRLQQHFRLFIVTNQPAVAEGEPTLDEVSEVNDWVVQWLQERGVEIAAVFCCPHGREDNCTCLKPKPHFLRQAARCHGLDLDRSFVIGDHPHDVELARNAGATGVYVLAGHGLRHRGELRGDDVVTDNIVAAADWILSSLTATAPRAPANRQQAMGVCA